VLRKKRHEYANGAGESFVNANYQVIAVLGAGSWGTALAHLLADKGCNVCLWARDEATAARLNHDGENTRYLPGVALGNMRISADLSHTLRDASQVVSAVPCAALPQLAREVSTRLAPGVVVISGTKGLHPESGLRASQTWAHEAGLPAEQFVALSGPNLAREIVAGVPTSTVVASLHEESAQTAQELFSTQSFRVYTNDDLLGVELGGA
jgi:glycerol-3-phosphate dehydrogenase (NAD(P)+)